MTLQLLCGNFFAASSSLHLSEQLLPVGMRNTPHHAKSRPQNKMVEKKQTALNVAIHGGHLTETSPHHRKLLRCSFLRAVSSQQSLRGSCFAEQPPRSRFLEATSQPKLHAGQAGPGRAGPQAVLQRRLLFVERTPLAK